MMKLFCIPYAGGSAIVYGKWQKYLHDSIELCPVELAGRGRRFSEPFYKSMDEAVEDITKVITENLDESAYAVWGHSMGSTLAMRSAFQLKKLGIGEPAHVFLSGSYPPHLKKQKERGIYKFPEDEFKREIHKLGGTTQEFFECKELCDIFIPVLRSDYRIYEEYEYKPCDFQCNSDITVLSGNSDIEVSRGEALQWNRYTTGKTEFYEMDGGHFFINDHVGKIAAIINNKLLYSCFSTAMLNG